MMESFNVCKSCGDSTSVSRCGACKEVYYCNRDHQRADWENHKAFCRHVSKKPMSVWIMVGPKEGSGIGNPMEAHLFDTKEEGYKFASDVFSGSISRPLPSPFCQLLGWNVEIFCSTNYNEFVHPFGQGIVDVVGKVHNLNSAGIFLGCDLQSGLSRYNNLSGPIFVTGRNSHGKPITAPALWGVINFIWDAMDDYGNDDPPLPIILRRAERYKNKTWGPLGGDCDEDIHAYGPPEKARLFKKAAIDHRRN